VVRYWIGAIWLLSGRGLAADLLPVRCWWHVSGIVGRGPAGFSPQNQHGANRDLWQRSVEEIYGRVVRFRDTDYEF